MATLVTGLFNSRSGADPAVEGPVDYGDSRDDIILLLSDALVVANSLFRRQPSQVHPLTANPQNESTTRLWR
jgi:hypothetical protein